MNLESWLLYLHVLGAIVWIGGGAALSILGLRARRSPDRAVVVEFAKMLRYLGLRAFTPALVVVLATGLVMVLVGAEWKISQPWILVGVVLFLIAFLIGAVYLSRVSMALERAVTEPDWVRSETAALVSRWAAGYAGVLLVLVVAVWDMVFKPFA